MSGSHHEKDTERVARGLKASIHNPRVSQEAKIHAEERLHEMGIEIGTKSVMKTTGGGHRRSGRSGRETKHASKVAAEDEPVPEQVIEAEAQEAADELKEEGKGNKETVEEPGEEVNPTLPHEKNEARVIGGYKATLSKKGVSAEAKRHARQYLEEHEAL